jgi:hypothetical protein
MNKLKIVIILYTVYLLLAHLVYTRTWIMKLWYIWNSVSFQNRRVELLEQVHTVLRVHIRMPKVDCSSLLLYVYVFLCLVNSRCSRFEWMSVLMLNTIRTREELLKFKLHSYHILPKGAVPPPIVLHVCSLITRLVDLQEVCNANSTGPCWNFVGPPNMYTSLFGVLVHFGLLGFYSVNTSLESILVCLNILSLLHVCILAKGAE